MQQTNLDKNKRLLFLNVQYCIPFVWNVNFSFHLISVSNGFELEQGLRYDSSHSKYFGAVTSNRHTHIYNKDGSKPKEPKLAAKSPGTLHF